MLTSVGSLSRRSIASRSSSISSTYGIGKNEAANAASPIESNPTRWLMVMLPMKQRIAVKTNMTTAPISRNIFTSNLSLAAWNLHAGHLGKVYPRPRGAGGYLWNTAISVDTTMLSEIRLAVITAVF